MSGDTPTEPSYVLSKGPQLIRVLRDAKGRIIDGRHRKDTDPNWKEETLLEIDTDRKYYAAQLQTNFNRRTMSRDEAYQLLKKLAVEIIKENGPKDLFKKVHEESGVSYAKIYELLGDDFGRPGLPKPQSTAPRRKPKLEQGGEDEEGTEEEDLVQTPTRPSPSSIQFDSFAFDIIGQNAGIEYGELQTKVEMICRLSPEDARNYIERFKQNFSDIWFRVYDSENHLLMKKVTPQAPPTPQQPAAAVQPLYTGGPIYRRDPLLEEAMRFYPDSVITELWDAIGERDKRLPFLRAFFHVAFEAAKAANPIEELVTAARNKMDTL